MHIESDTATRENTLALYGVKRGLIRRLITALGWAA